MAKKDKDDDLKFLGAASFRRELLPGEKTMEEQIKEAKAIIAKRKAK
jgi:hypothetical protein